MKNKFFAFLLSASVLFTLSGCQLAQDEVTSVIGNDRLIGGLVTTESLVTYDVEAYLNAHPEVLLQKDGVTIPANDAPIYAVVENMTAENEVYTFPGIDGIVFYDLISYNAEDNAMHAVSGPNQGATDHIVGYRVENYNYETGEGTQRLEIKATVSYDQTKAPEIFHLNPIYQTEDGKVYVKPGGSGISAEAEMDGTSMTCSSSFTYEETSTQGGTYTTSGSTVVATIQFRYPAETIALVQMDQKNRELARVEFLPGEAPEELTPEGETAYLLVEHHRTGSQEIDRELVSRGEEYLYTYELQPSGFFYTQTTHVLWGE